MPKYPDRIEYDIDRKRLVRYWRLQSVIMLAIAGVFVFLVVCMAMVEHALENDTGLPVADFVDLVAHRFATAALCTLASLTGVYFLFVHFQVRGRAMRMRLLVEGPYLRLIRGSSLFRNDRRIHFRAISDYSALDGPLLGLLGLRSLSFRVIGLGQQSVTTIPAIIDTQKVRDDLCAIDAMREGH